MMTRHGRTSRRKLWRAALLAITACLALIPLSGVRADEDDQGQDAQSRACAIGLWGDLPYSDLQALVGVPNLIADMNRQKLAFTVHDGDLKGGNGTPGSTTPTVCSDALYVQALGFFNALHSAAIFTPGDNDWTDCDRPSNGSFSSRGRLDHERQLFFSTVFSLGQSLIKQEVQTDKLCLDHFRRWTKNGVVYATLNIQGSCNNLCDTLPDPAEWAARNRADILWIQQTFAKAKAIGAAAIMLISQGPVGWDAGAAVRPQNFGGNGWATRRIPGLPRRPA